jgi:hypothetical protein
MGRKYSGKPSRCEEQSMAKRQPQHGQAGNNAQAGKGALPQTGLGQNAAIG